MKFSEFSHLDYEPEFSQGLETISHAILSKDNTSFYEIVFPFYQNAYEQGGRNYNNDLQNFRENPTLNIYKPKFSYDEMGDEYIDGVEKVFSGTLEEAKQDERFKDFEFKQNVRSENVVFANSQDFENLEQEKTQNNEHSQENSQANSQKEANSQQNSQQGNENEESYSNHSKQRAYENAFDEYDTLRANNKDFDELHKARETKDKIDDEIQKNEKDIIDKEEKIKKKQEKLEEEQRQKQKNANNFNDDEIDDKDPLAQEKRDLQALKEKNMALKEQRKECQAAIAENVGKITSSKDPYEVYMALIKIYKNQVQARKIGKNIKYNDEKIKELEEKINGYNEKLRSIFKKIGSTKEGKELFEALTKEVFEIDKETRQESKNLEKESKYYKDLDMLLRKRTNTTNKDKNTQDISTLMKKIQKECTDFANSYPNSFKQAQGIINENSKSQYQGRSA